ncbi:group II intron reverse transcriptase/maturase [Aliarcobacter cryaerophilus]|uniref:group II intron reverse transcriptase/maturase n=1 Tax=Aliarcobacter cryaerophilus TaxID=28198 RepID=UPI0021B41481|nr:group II intron reverse transcriptase/maturase [Aliarcobacter cryaerophilus]MCT7468519.1 group II intron reverse transcriptase/maturase [Aliarcobacter cryaerophilus]
MIEADKKVITHINWLAVDFDIVEQSVKILQNRIVKAKLASRSRMVKKLQSLLVKSLNARILAVKRVSENKGKNTAGVDGKLLDTNIKKSKYVADLKIKLPDYKSMPLKRIEIPKKNGKLRPLGIPTMFDRSIQALYKIALEPIAEVVADKNSYGFRPKRSTQDAMKQVWLCTSKKNGGEWILEADIKGCFDNISHQWMYDNIPLDNRLLKQWLKSGFIKDDTLFPTDAGTPQGGIISPILANMVLDGIEDIVKNHKARFQKMVNGVIIYRHTNRLNFIRYADDFVITGRTPEDLQLVQKDIEKFLNIRGLELSKEKTHITNIRDGFDFLGFNFRKYPNDKVIVTPTKDGIKSFKSKIKEIFKKYNSSSLTMLITKLNPLLRGWANYYRFVNSKVIFSKLDSYIWRKSLNWMKRIHQRRETKKYYKQYFKPFPNYKSDALSDGRQFVYRLSTLPLKEFIKIKSEANPYDTSFDDYFIKRYFTLKNLTKKI